MDRDRPWAGAVVLAAGASRRMGRQKLRLRLGGRALLQRVVGALFDSPVVETVVVVGCESERLLPLLRGLPARIVCNDDWAEGQSTSVRVGLAALGPAVGGVLFCPADQAWLTSDLVGMIIERWHASGARIVAPACGDRRGGPVLFARDLFPELMELRGDVGGRRVMAAHPDEVETVQVADSRLLDDIDTEADYLRALKEIGDEVTTE